MQVIERVEAHYEVLETPYGTSYRWCPVCLRMECGCGETLEFKSPADRCRCGAACGASAAVFEASDRERKEPPWRREAYEPATEKDYWLELRALE